MHERAIQSLRYTIGLDQSAVDTLDVIRRKRHQSNYERAGTASPSEATEVLEIAKDLNSKIREWFKEKHPNLV